MIILQPHVNARLSFQSLATAVRCLHALLHYGLPLSARPSHRRGYGSTSVWSSITGTHNTCADIYITRDLNIRMALRRLRSRRYCPVRSHRPSSRPFIRRSGSAASGVCVYVATSRLAREPGVADRAQAPQVNLSAHPLLTSAPHT